MEHSKPKPYNDYILTTMGEVKRTGWEWQSRMTMFPSRFTKACDGIYLEDDYIVIARKPQPTFEEEVFDLLQDARYAGISGPDNYELTRSIVDLAIKHKHSIL